jgi:hypothetical protein
MLLVMSPAGLWAVLFPNWLRDWLQYYLLPKLGLEVVQFGVGLLNGSRLYMDGQYALPRQTQSIVLAWAPVADHIARQVDIPREVPLVLWFKENSMQSVNPDNCIGIMGTYDLVRSGQRPCFPPGPISSMEVSAQMAIGAVEYKKRCPEITCRTQSPDVIKRCYLAYNGGMGAARRQNPNNSAYVMNNYDAVHTNMIYSDIEPGTVVMTSLGAWPARH